MLQAKNNGQNLQQPGMPNGVPQQRGPLPANAMGPNGQQTPGQNLAVPGQNRPHPGMPMAGQVPMNPALQVPQMQMNGIPQQMAGMPGRLPVPNPKVDLGLVNQVHRITEQQRAQVLQNQQRQAGPMHNSPQNMRLGVLPQGGSFPQNMMPHYNPNVPNGVGSPSQNGLNASTPGVSASPRPPSSQQQMQAQANAIIQRIEATVRQQHPNATQPEFQQRVQQLFQQTLLQQQHQSQQQQQPQQQQPQQQQQQQQQQQHQRAILTQSAMNAAAGAMPDSNHAQVQAHARVLSGGEGAPGPTPQAYAHMLQAQQAKQQLAVINAASANANAANGNGAPNMGQALGQLQTQNRVQSQSPVAGTVPSHGSSQSPVMNQSQVQGQVQAQQTPRSSSAGSGK